MIKSEVAQNLKVILVQSVALALSLKASKEEDLMRLTGKIL